MEARHIASEKERYPWANSLCKVSILTELPEWTVWCVTRMLKVLHSLVKKEFVFSASKLGGCHLTWAFLGPLDHIMHTGICVFSHTFVAVSLVYLPGDYLKLTSDSDSIGGLVYYRILNAATPSPPIVLMLVLWYCISQNMKDKWTYALHWWHSEVIMAAIDFETVCYKSRLPLQWLLDLPQADTLYYSFHGF